MILVMLAADRETIKIKSLMGHETGLQDCGFILRK